MTKPNCEHIAVANLCQQGFDCYSPRYKQTRLDKSVVIKPLFPRYIFTLINNIWYSIRGTRGVSHLLMGENGPAQVPPSVIATIKAREDLEGYVMLTPKLSGGQKFSKGDQVRAIDGPLVDKLLTYEGTASHDRVKVLLAMLGRQVPVTIEEKLLVAV
jgi:transcription antitermination factor NusG